jgi:imidazolonepropionase-like amidohydrolase
VRTIEHGNLIDARSARLLASKGGYMIANLVTYFIMKERAASLGMTADMLAKNDLVLDGALKSLEICKKAGVKVGYGSDLLGPLQIEQSREFLFRAEVLKPIEIIRQATIVGAEILRQEGKLGIVEPGAFADLIVVDGNPLKKLELFLDQGAHLPAIMKAGKFHKNALK